MSGAGDAGAGGTDALPHEAWLVALASLPEVGQATLRRLLRLGAPQEVWAAVRAGRVPAHVLRGTPGDRPEVRARWARVAAGLDVSERWRRCIALGLGVASLGSAGYPPALAEDPEAPVVVFLRGRPEALAGTKVAIVGTRRATGYGRSVAHRLGAELTGAGIGVVSGLALGIDAAAHAGAVDPLGEQGDPAAAPVAVVAAGLDRPGPVRNAALARAVAARGVILSEVPPDVRAEPWRFPVRNRLLVALSCAVVVVESARTGGSMITVRHAVDRGVPILAVPGPVDSAVSAGPNDLLADVAVPCRDVDDVLVALDLSRAGPLDTGNPSGGSDLRPDPGPEGSRVLEELGWRPEPVERVLVRSGLAPAVFAVVVGRLVESGWVRDSGGFLERVAAPRAPSGPADGRTTV